MDSYPYLEEPRCVPWPPGWDSGSDHFIICQAEIDAGGRVQQVRALGCEEPKGPLCDQVVAHVSGWRFHPARARDSAVAAVVVFPVVFKASSDSGGQAGVPIVDEWDEARCRYSDRIYGSAELHSTHRPVVLERVIPAYPDSALRAAITGRVDLRAVVDPDGIPCFVLCDSASPQGLGFVEAAVRAAYGYRFSPGRNAGGAQAVWVALPFTWQP